VCTGIKQLARFPPQAIPLKPDNCSGQDEVWFYSLLALSGWGVKGDTFLKTFFQKVKLPGNAAVTLCLRGEGNYRKQSEVGQAKCKVAKCKVQYDFELFRILCTFVKYARKPVPY
jgi:hypothetical protein